MVVIISGRIHDSGNKPLSEVIMVEAFEHAMLFANLSRHIAPAVSADVTTGYFRIVPIHSFGLNIGKTYLVITDSNKRFEFVREGQKEFTKINDDHGNVKWKSQLIDDLTNIDIMISLSKPHQIPANRYEAVVIGSGFGGTIVSLTLANKFADQDQSQNNKRVCVLERGQWWVSNEMPSISEGTTDKKSNIRQYLEEGNIPYHTYVYPDNIKGLLRVFGTTRIINSIRGLYDYRIMKNVHVVAASGVGGGSLVYFNVTEKPDSSVYKDWPIQNDKMPLDAKYSYKDIYGNKDADLNYETQTGKKLFYYFDIDEN